MKYSKLLSKCFTHKSNSGQVLVAVVAGLAAGAILSILLAPESGEDTRGLIADKAKGFRAGIKDKYSALKNKLTGEEEEDDSPSADVPHFINNPPIKKRKSDIKEIISEAHHSEHPDESQA